MYFFIVYKNSIRLLFSPDAREKPRLFWRALEKQQENDMLKNPKLFAPIFDLIK
jgi:hypothetical protein